ncbi:MAG: hypothetical protein KDC26_02910 [Armatimonadetes bacterium]|nr:hypothetical protein [Armatimonadota bacterium]
MAGSWRGLLAASLAVCASVAIAQTPEPGSNTNTQKQLVSSAPVKPVITDSRKFFPQVNRTAGRKNLKPENPKDPNGFLIGPPNNLRMGDSILPNNNKAGAKFPGIGFTGLTPPDPHLAVGPNHVLQVVNTKIAWYDKLGNIQFEQNFDNSGFYAGLAGNFVFDPKVVYDPVAKRFVTIVLDVDFDTFESYFFISVSDDDDPNGLWYTYKIENTVSVGGDLHWGDYPSITSNGDMMACSFNMFPFANGGVFAMVIAFDVAEAATGADLNLSSFFPNGFTLQMSRVFGDTGGSIFAIGKVNNSTMRLTRIRRVGPNKVLSQTNIAVPAYSNAPLANAVGDFRDTIGDRVLCSAVSDNKIVAAMSIGDGPGGAARVGWWEFDPSDWPVSGSPTLVQSGVIQATQSGRSIYMPSIAINQQGTISVIATASSQSESPSIVVSSRKATDPLGQMSVPFKLASSPNYAGFGFSLRWGDYASVVPDPNDHTRFFGTCNTAISSFTWTTDIVTWQFQGGVGGGSNDVAPTSVTPVIGSVSGGSVADFAALDSSTYDVTSVLVPNRGFYAAYDMTFVAPSSTSNRIRATVSAQSTTSAVAGYVYIWNFNTNAWEYMGSGTFGTAQTELSFLSRAGASDFIDGSNNVQVRVFSLQPIRRRGGSPLPYDLQSDFANLQFMSN